jgi:subtilisin family serine protease
MGKKILLGSVIICIATLFYLPTRSNSFYVQEEYVPNEVLVKFKKAIDINDIQSAINSIQGKIIKYSGDEIPLSSWSPENLALRSFRLDPDLLRVKVPDSIGTEYAIYLLNQNPLIEYAEKNLIGHLCEVEPFDPDFELQWALKNTGQAEGTVGADIKATFAWDFFTGSPDIVVAVIDSGVNYIHEDLSVFNNIYLNEDDPINGQDDDNNGYTDDFHGWDFVQI